MKQTHLFHLIQHIHASPTHASPIQSQSPDTLRNIFLASAEKMAEHELQHAKNYQLVGVRELKAYKNRAKKRTKLSARDKDDLPTDRSISHESSKKKTRPDPDLLNKEEVIDCLPKLSRDLSSQHLSQIHKGSWIDAFTLNENAHHPGKLTEPKRILRQFSVVRIRHKMQEHENEWRRVLRTHKEGEKFPTLGDSIVAYRHRREEAEGSGINENLVNIKSSYWGNTLRNCRSIDDICYPRKEIHTLHEGVKAKGYSKLIREVDWLQGKDQQGFRFKNCPDITLPLPILKPSIR